MISLPQRLELHFLAAIPALITLFLALLYLVPKHVGGLNSVMPLLPVMAVFYWAMLRGTAIPYWFVFAMGLVMDAVVGTPLGLTSLVYILFLYAVLRQRKYIHKEGFLVKWGCFAVLLLIALSIGWLLLSWFHTAAMPVVPSVIQWGLTIACYPVAHKLFDFLDTHVHDRRWQIMHG